MTGKWMSKSFASPSKGGTFKGKSPAFVTFPRSSWGTALAQCFSATVFHLPVALKHSGCGLRTASAESPASFNLLSIVRILRRRARHPPGSTPADIARSLGAAKRPNAFRELRQSVLSFLPIVRGTTPERQTGRDCRPRHRPAFAGFYSDPTPRLLGLKYLVDPTRRRSPFRLQESFLH